jgi:predicted RNase H-like HicB family nuclease
LICRNNNSKESHDQRIHKRRHENAHYEIIEDEEPYYGEIAELKGVWVTGKTLEECRDNLTENLEGWILIRNSYVGWACFFAQHFEVSIRRWISGLPTLCHRQDT